jgi:exodeoxyribonuclease VII large subunit
VLGLRVVEPVLGMTRQGTWSVAALVHAVTDLLATRFASCVVQGELSGFSRAASGHCYFGLKDAQGGAVMLRCAMFRRAASLIDFAPSEGQLVELRGRVAVYEPRGELQFVVESMQRFGAGALFEQFVRLKARLEALGLFDVQRKRAIPSHPRCIGVVSSLGAAALQDVLSTLARRSPQVSVVIIPSLVQGAEAPAALVRALEIAGQRADIDTLILCRGGGSLEDLWSFNDERVVRAVAASPIPLVCGVGHETDVTLCDLAADLRAATPTAAAELAAPEAATCQAALQNLQLRLQRQVRAVVDGQAQRLDHAARRLARPADGVRRRHQPLELLAQRLDLAVRHAVQGQRVHLAQHEARWRRAGVVVRAAEANRLDALGARLRLLDPQQVLERGYAWLTDAEGHVLTSSRSLHAGQPVQAQLADGRAALQVVTVASEVTP